ncbi:hypothetical protein DIURU_002341 [Diutina rugosa]|uniref:Zn(2)-C6 fungal-type domain-containing protein n=1 Tax=Diutina rugosa TaxID=5481 RepID=A0A642UWU2_DIURU|nr:uncharacterized protein DIURU_002341 [Diutina rugosa]KAA8903455.1 hypothetical protein DIURU_002341 [Diutina rugosa]
MKDESPGSHSAGEDYGMRAKEDANKYKRNYRACLNCRVRKVKCDLGPVDSPREGKCARCLRERKDCVFVESKRGGATNVIMGRQKRKYDEVADETYSNKPIVRDNFTNVTSPPQGMVPPSGSMPIAPPSKLPSVTSMLQRNNEQILTESQTPPPSASAPPPASDQAPPSAESSHFSTMEGALVFLAKAAGTIAKADERDNIDAMKRHQQIASEEQERRHSDTHISTVSDGISSSTTMTRDPTNLDMLLNSQSPHQSPPLTRTASVPEYIQPSKRTRMRMPPAENGYVVRPRASNKLSNIDYIGEGGIVSEVEAERLINYFFSTMHPFFPHLPKFLESPNVLANYPILLCAILTIASRYHPFEDNVGTTGGGGVPRNIEVHDRLWLYVQRLISQTVWAEASTRSLGTVFAFLLFTEWNPRAIHWRWSDYANKAEDPETDVGGVNGAGASAGAKPAAHDTSGENLAGLGAMRRSYRMAWMLIGSAVRLAQDMGFMEISPKTFLATHLAEINSVMNISRRSMLAHSLAEVELDEDDVSVEQMEQSEDVDDKIIKMTEEQLKRLSSEHVLRFTESQKAQIELLQIMSVGHEALYGYKAQLGSLSQRQNLMILNIFSPLINNWGRKYRHFLVPSTTKMLRNVANLQHVWSNPNSKVAKEITQAIEQESFIFEFNYLKLYIFSLALSPTPPTKVSSKSKRKPALKLDEISRSAKYIEQAFTAANEMLISAHRVHKLKMLRFMPVRWLTRLVRAVAFIVKCYLTITAHKRSQRVPQNQSSSYDIDSTVLSLSLISIDDIIQSIQRAAITLRDCSPDELHLCTRYSNILMYLCSEMKTTKTGDSDEVPANVATNATATNDAATAASGPATSTTNTNSDDLNDPSNFSIPLKMFDINFGDDASAKVTGTTSSPSTGGTPNQVIGDSEVMEWFVNDRNIGLDFVGPWTEMIEQQLNMNEPSFNFEDGL